MIYLCFLNQRVPEPARRRAVLGSRMVFDSLRYSQLQLQDILLLKVFPCCMLEVRNDQPEYREKGPAKLWRYETDDARGNSEGKAYESGVPLRNVSSLGREPLRCNPRSDRLNLIVCDPVHLNCRTSRMTIFRWPSAAIGNMGQFSGWASSSACFFAIPKALRYSGQMLA